MLTLSSSPFTAGSGVASGVSNCWVVCEPELAVPAGLGSERCWIMVELTANLYFCFCSSDEDSEMSDCRILLMMVVFQPAVSECE